METLIKVGQYVRDRLKEPSTIPAIMFMVGALGHWGTTSEPERQQIVLDVILFVAGLLGAILPDTYKKPDPEATLPPQPPKGTP
jgi:hypothetical protein